MVVDDQAVFRRAARMVIDATPGFETVGEAASGSEALLSVGELAPQVVLMDVRMPGLSGVEAARRLAVSHPDTVVVLVSLEDLPDLADSALACGAAAVLRKQDFNPGALRSMWSVHGR